MPPSPRASSSLPRPFRSFPFALRLPDPFAIAFAVLLLLGSAFRLGALVVRARPSNDRLSVLLVVARSSLGFTDLTPATASRRDDQIVAVVRVTLRAVRFPSVATMRRLPASDILCVCHRFEMRRVRARAIRAEVIEFQANWHRPDESTVRMVVNVDPRPVDGRASVAGGTTAAWPSPAAVRVSGGTSIQPLVHVDRRFPRHVRNLIREVHDAL